MLAKLLSGKTLSLNSLEMDLAFGYEMFAQSGSVFNLSLLPKDFSGDLLDVLKIFLGKQAAAEIDQLLPAQVDDAASDVRFEGKTLTIGELATLSVTTLVTQIEQADENDAKPTYSLILPEP